MPETTTTSNTKTTAPIITLAELLEKIPEPWRPVAEKYAPSLLRMGVNELWAWIDQVARGDAEGAYKALLAGLESPALLDEWTRLTADWQSANKENAARVSLQREAMIAVLRVSLGAALALVGL